MLDYGWLNENGRGVEQNLQEALAWYERAAEAGEAIAMRNLGIFYRYGTAVEQDWNRAVSWFERAAEQGDADSMVALAEMYRGDGDVETDYSKSADWLRKASALGRDDAMFALGTLYASGNGVEQDYKKARTCYERAAELGNYMAMNNLAVIYENGRGVEKDLDKARYWYERSDTMRHVMQLREHGRDIDITEAVGWDLNQLSLFLQSAADQGDGQAIVDLSVLEEHHNSDYLTSGQIERWADAAKSRGDGNALYGIALLYIYGNGVHKDVKAGVNYYTQAADLGSLDAMVKLGDYWVYEDTAVAKEWFLKAIDSGSVLAMRRLGTYYLMGWIGNKEYKQAVEWLLKAVENGDDNIPGDFYLLGDAYSRMKDYENALYWFKRGALEYGSTDCMKELAQIYSKGQGVEKDPQEAAKWKAMAKEAGSANQA